VTCDYGQPRRERIDGIELLATFPPLAGLPGVRFFHPRLTRTVAALARADADVYYERGSGFPAGIAYDVARLKRAAFVLGIAHDHDVRRALPLQNNPRDRWWYRRALLGAAAVLTQTRFQRELLRTEFGRDGDVVPNLVEVPDPVPPQGRAMAGVAGPPEPRVPAVRGKLAARGAVRGAGRFSATLAGGGGGAEGFPNTMLEAWAHGLPAIACVDPDGVLARERIGESVGTLDEMIVVVERWMASEATRREAGERALGYVRREHAPPAVLDRLAGRFERVVEGVRRRTPVQSTPRTPGG
jgi:glycosyltransferase involved in cell wall biosynthesis